MKFLLDRGIDVNVQDNARGAPLINACYYEDIVKIKLESGADANIQDARGFTPLLVASQY